jgi:hypothetical protein
LSRARSPTNGKAWYRIYRILYTEDGRLFVKIH